ncbi:MAG: hypothetical protein HGB19_10385 [Chlorobiales bacterium]|nr:hypothetical protein [Chlorobiales bacterium]
MRVSRRAFSVSVLLCIAMMGCSTMNDVLKGKNDGTSETYPVKADQAWEIAKTALQMEDCEAIEEHRSLCYMLTTVGGGLMAAGCYVGVWVDSVDQGNTKVTVVTRRKSLFAGTFLMTEGAFQKRFAQAADMVKSGELATRSDSALIQIDQKLSTKSYSVYGGFGTSSFLPFTMNIGIAYHTGISVLSLRGILTSYPPTPWGIFDDNLWEIGALYGVSTKPALFVASVGIGVSVVGGGYAREGKRKTLSTTVGLPIDAQLFLRVGRFSRVGFCVIGDINSAKSFAGVTFGWQYYWL